MNNPSIDKILATVGSKYVLVHVVSQRSKQMIETKHYQKKEKEYLSKKPIGRALEEMESGLIKIIRND